ncbi:hypothetical protein MKJ04_12520 [Pontibacter sp. E15-1]|uniref:hypothetical protein n=1 Tax=Pontibacter sp. E15-1 TaxID=2919918 RepID=UPI001F4F443D|nr:hypothetical protein [Pontibacter sp. E15-1]MCJ8165668.1 hypothetical protein [Pontibacter sp. E15-1]
MENAVEDAKKAADSSFVSYTTKLKFLEAGRICMARPMQNASIVRGCKMNCVEGSGALPLTQ